MSVYFTSDLHLGHGYAARCRGFLGDVEAHDLAVAESFLGLPRRSKLFVLGDVAFRKESMRFLHMIPCETMDLVHGNHDLLPTEAYLKFFRRVDGAISYKNFWLTHIPIHPQEIFRGEGNIHGHIHKHTLSPPIEDPRYFCVNWDFHRGPVAFELIQEHVREGRTFAYQ